MNHCHNVFFNTKLPESPPNYIPRDTVKGFLKVHKGHPQIPLFYQVSLLELSQYEHCIRCALCLPGVNPNCISSICRICLSRASITLSNTFIACSSSFIPRYEPHSRAFVHIYPVVSVSIIWHLTLFHNRFAKISQPSNAIFARTFQQLSSYPCGSWSLIAFYFCNTIVKEGEMPNDWNRSYMINV